MTWPFSGGKPLFLQSLPAQLTQLHLALSAEGGSQRGTKKQRKRERARGRLNVRAAQNSLSLMNKNPTELNLTSLDLGIPCRTAEFQ